MAHYWLPKFSPGTDLQSYELSHFSTIINGDEWKVDTFYLGEAETEQRDRSILIYELVFSLSLHSRFFLRVSLKI